jgi:hypothetical protein
MLPNSFSASLRASGLVFMFCSPGLVFGGTEGVGSRFHVLRSRTHFRRYWGRWVPFSYFARRTHFSAVPRASGPVFSFCAPGLVFGDTEGVRTRFHVVRSRTRFRRYRGRRFPFSRFAFPDTFSAVPGGSTLVFLFCALVLIFYGTMGVGSCFMSCAPGLIFGGTEGVVSRIHVLCYRTRFRPYRGCRVSFSCFARPDSFWRYRGSRVPFSCFACPDSFSAKPRASSPVFIFCTPGLVFSGTEGVVSHFHVLCSRTHFRRYRVRRVSFS